MRLVNETSWPAILQQADFGTATRHAVVIMKATYVREPGGRLVAASDPMPVTGDPVETPFGILNGDVFLRKEGADLCVLGTLRRSRKIKETTVSLSCGAFKHSLRISGNRAWVPKGLGKELVPSGPVPFAQMELTYQRAYGGVARAGGLEAPNADNPIGRGYYLSREEALGKVLPNIESATAPPIRSWKDQPAPAGWAPYFMSWGLRARQAVALEPTTGTLLNVYPTLFNNAHPDLVLPAIEPGMGVMIDGARDEPWGFTIPELRGRVRVTVGEESFEVPTRIDGVLAWLDADRVVVTQRANFKYVVVPRQRRGATLTASDGIGS